MKTSKTIECKHIISEPGDATRYDYIMIQNYDEYMFMPYKNTFRYPQRLNWWDVKDIEIINETVETIAKENNCNSWTVMECIRSIKEATK
jgi:hypothetical protein